MVDRPHDERNWYKLATFVLSIITLLVAFVSGVYYKRIDLRNQHVRQMEDRVERLVARREKLLATPKVQIHLLTLANSGLPEAAFRTLREIPAVLRIQHVGGTTAKGLTVILESNEPIVRIAPNASVENYATHLSEDRKTITFDVGQLRPKSVVDATVMCRGTTRLNFKATLSDGVLIDTESRDASRDLRGEDLIRQARRQFDLSFYNRNGDIDSTDPADLDDERAVNAAIDSVRGALRAERDAPLLLPASGSLALTVVAVLTFAVLFLGIVFGIYDFSRGRSAKREGDKIRVAQRDSLIQPGTTRESAREILGEPHSVLVEPAGERWLYKPYDSVFFASNLRRRSR